MPKIWLYPGSFDPVTVGHLDIIERAAAQCDRLIIAVAQNSDKKSRFPIDRRVWYLRQCTEHLGDKVKILESEGLTVKFAKARGVEATALVRGLRNPVDFNMEQQIAAVNYQLDSDIETIFFLSKPSHVFVSSSVVREVGKYGGDLSGLVHPIIIKDVSDILKHNIFLTED